MKQNFLMPKLGLTMTEGVLVEWTLAPGQRFKKDQTIYVVESEKAANEVAAESDGVLIEILAEVGDTVPVGDVLAVWEDGSEAGEAGTFAASETTAEVTESDAQAESVAQHEPDALPSASPADRLVATPLARRTAVSHDVDLRSLNGSGPNGRIKHADVMAAAGKPSGSPSNADGRRVEPTGIQASMARRLTAAKQEVPHFYLALDADVGKLMELRADLNDARGSVRNQQASHKLTLNHFIIAALGRALIDEPGANRIWSDDAITQFDTADVGIAVNTERGLFVPVLRDAGKQPLGELARQASALVERARGGRLSAAEMAGGAVTVSNAGMFNVTYMTPIISPGQSMILGVGSVKEVFRPDARGQPLLKREMGLVLACDHRVHDGVAGLRFFNAVVRYLERPVALLAT